MVALIIIFNLTLCAAAEQLRKIENIINDCSTRYPNNPALQEDIQRLQQMVEKVNMG